MAAPRQSAFMPTIKCSQCGNEVEISMMGEHLCKGAPAEEVPPPPPPPDLLGGALASVKGVFGFGFGGGSAPATKAAPPPTVDTQTANQGYAKPDQLTPVSTSTGSRGTISPKTPTGRTNSTGGDEYFPTIAGSNSPSQNARPGGYGGFADEPEQTYPGFGTSPQKPANQGNLLQRKMENLSVAPTSLERSNTAASYRSDKPRVPRKNGYGGFGPPQTEQGEDFEPRMMGNQRAGTFPREGSRRSNSYDDDAPSRDPSRPDHARNATADYSERPMTRDRQNRPSYDAREPPQPSSLRGSYGRPQEARRNPSASLSPADSYSPVNPYHSPSVSQSSSNSGYSQASRQPSMASSNTSPARSTNSRRQNSGTQNLDDLMKDLESTIDSVNPRDMRRPPSRPEPPQSQSEMRNPRLDSLRSSSSQNMSNQRSRSPPRSPPSSRLEPSYAQPPRGYPDNRSRSPEPSYAQPPRGYPDNRSRSPAPEPPYSQPPRGYPDNRSRSPAPEPSYPQPPRGFSDNSSRSSAPQGSFSDNRSRSPEPMYPPPRGFSDNSSRSSAPAPRSMHNRAQSQGRPRGNCKACRLPITGKSVSSADGRLTGKYHKACFVCTTCMEPFSSAEFYVLDDQPYCERHYHKLNGSLCGDCSQGIEGQYLEDESAQKYHPRCFRCGDCGQVLQDGYFEVDGKSYCERDAWRRVQPPPQSPQARMGRGMMAPPPGRGGPRDPMGMGMGGRPPYGRPSGNGNRLGPPMPKMNKRMTRIGMI